VCQLCSLNKYAKDL